MAISTVNSGCNNPAYNFPSNSSFSSIFYVNFRNISKIIPKFLPSSKEFPKSTDSIEEERGGPMYPETQMLSVLNISEICDVARSTASYWITQKGLPAQRSGNKFWVSIEDLILFLESIGRPVPQILVEGLGGVYSHPFKSHQTCWNYWQKGSHKTT